MPLWCQQVCALICWHHLYTQWERGSVCSKVALMTPGESVSACEINDKDEAFVCFHSTTSLDSGCALIGRWCMQTLTLARKHLLANGTILHQVHWQLLMNHLQRRRVFAIWYQRSEDTLLDSLPLSPRLFGWAIAFLVGTQLGAWIIAPMPTNWHLLSLSPHSQTHGCLFWLAD